MTLSCDSSPVQLFPDNILDENHNGKPWRVAYTKSRREKALANHLSQVGIGYYLPMVKTRQSNQARIRFSLMPIFSNSRLVISVNTVMQSISVEIDADHIEPVQKQME